MESLATPRADRSEEQLRECHDCGGLQELPTARVVARLVCYRCEAPLGHKQHHALSLSFALAMLGLVLHVLAFTMPVASAFMAGRSISTALADGPEAFQETGLWLLSWVVVATLFALPAMKFAVVAAMTAAVWLGQVPRWLTRLFVAVPTLGAWAMVEVFMLGAMIALLRLQAWIHIDFGPALFALAGVAVCSVALDRTLDQEAFWRRVNWRRTSPRQEGDATLIGCEGCGLVANVPETNPCPRCDRPMRRRKPNSLARTWALVITALLLAVPANVLPIFSISKLGRGGPKTIMGGTIELVQEGFWPLALLVFVASILVPLFKLGVLVTLLVTTSRPKGQNLKLRTRLHRLVAVIGRWSMLDIFATMMLAALARFSWVGSVVPDTGASAFCGVVLVTMLASESFDPRLMWDAAGHNAALHGSAEPVPAPGWGTA